VCRQAIYVPRISPAYYGFVVEWNAQTGGGGKYLSGSAYFNGGTLTATNVNGGINSTYGNTTPPERIT